MTNTPKPRPLDGLRVLDFTRVISGPHCGKVLVDLGADVIKLEPPEGDVTRTAQPRPGGGISILFTQMNCGKRDISIDLGHPEGRRVALELAARCDVVLENFRPGVMDRLGVGFAAVRELNPAVVYCSISGFGQTGSAAGRQAYAQIVQAEMGVVEFAARRQRHEPRSEPTAAADTWSALHAVIGILAALRHRDRTGEGQQIDVSMAETLLAVHEWSATEIHTDSPGTEPLHVFGAYNAPVLQTGDGSSAAFAGDPAVNFALWVEMMGRPDLLEDDRFRDAPSRAAHRRDLLEVLASWAQGFPTYEALEAVCRAKRIPVGRVQSFAEVGRQPWLAERNAFVDIADRGGDGTTLALPRAPWRFSAMDAGVRGVAPFRGEHNGEVLGEVLGYGAQQIDELEASGALSRRIPDGKGLRS